jgi:hypothetical protein
MSTLTLGCRPASSCANDGNNISKSRLSNFAGTRVYYTGVYLPNPDIYYGDNFDLVVEKLSQYISTLSVGILQYFKFAINIDGSGTPTPNFDAYKPAGATLTDTLLKNKRIVTVFMNGLAYQDYFIGGLNKIMYDISLGELDFSAVGLLEDGSYVIVICQPQ